MKKSKSYSATKIRRRQTPAGKKSESERQIWANDIPAFIAFARLLGESVGHDFCKDAEEIFFGVARTAKGIELARARLLERVTDWTLEKLMDGRFSVEDLLGRPVQTTEDVLTAVRAQAAWLQEELRVSKGGESTLQ